LKSRFTKREIEGKDQQQSFGSGERGKKKDIVAYPVKLMFC